jgi:ubiquitin C-terminal hydrolase
MKNILLQAKSKVPKVTSFDSVSDGIPSYKYSLFSVVCHQGKIDTGHYQSFCRVRDRFDTKNCLSQLLGGFSLMIIM